MYKTGDKVIYPGTGVCIIKDIINQKFLHTDERTYYVLKAVYDNSDTTIYCPVDSTEVNLKKLLDKDEILELIHTIPQKTLWIENDNERRKLFSALLREGDRQKLLCMITEIHKKLKEKEAEGKKLHLSDEKALEKAEKMLYQEIAYSLNMEIEAVSSFIRNETAEIFS
ncbi:MAG: CarD family transcriptional regulator [Ruminococcaceae bacterium]|nr:CarD family transcriptional regulator [Oscillospiraceae bacterium]